MRSNATEANPFKAFIAKHGVALDLRSEFAPGAAEQRKAMVPGFGPIFRKSGKQLDALAQAAVEEGFLTEASDTALHDLIGRAIRGERIIPQFAAGVAESEMESRVARHRELEEDAALNALTQTGDALAFDLQDADLPWDAPVSTSTTEQFLRALGASEQEIQDALIEESRGTEEGTARRGGPEQGATGTPQTGSEQPYAAARPADRREAGQVSDQDLLGTAPSAGQQAAATERARRTQAEQAQRSAAPDAAGFTLGMEDSRTGREVAPGQGELAMGGDADAPSTIQDLGEKIGGARKDTSIKTGPTGTRKVADERPAWARRFSISQIDKDMNLRDEGRWTIRDTRTLDRFKQPRELGRETYATREEAEAALPLLAVARKHRVVPTSKRDGSYEIWRDVSERKRVKVVDKEFASRTDALEYMAQNAQAIIEANTTFGEADLPVPADQQRRGPSRRTGDVDGQAFMDTFGFRGVEFGNWNNQADRQALMNDAFDGLMDLADVLGVPPKALALNGDLALAFGARGQGLSGARAHYEPGRAVMNLTKMNGAGALAHEWFHALDHYFGRQDGKASAEWKVEADGTRTLQAQDAESNMVSSGFSGSRSGVRQEVRDAYRSLMETLALKAEQYVEDTQRADNFVATSRKDVADRLAKIRAELARQLDPKYYKRHNQPATAEQLAEFDALAQKIENGESVEIDWRNIASSKSRMGTRWTNDALEAMSVIHKAVRGRTGFDGTNQNGVLDQLRGDMSRYSQRLKMLADAQGSTEKSRQVPTDFAMDARSLDQGRGTDYWTTPHEMVARAFQGYVEDKVAAAGGASPFLNYGPENVGILTPWGAKRPFPAGQERVAINQALDKLVKVLQTRETDKGVALFSTRDGEAPVRGLSLEQAQQAVQKALAGFSNPPPVDIVMRSEDAWARAPDGVMGAAIPSEGRIIIVAGAHRSAGDVVQTLFHEMFHLGLRNVLPSRDYAQAMLDLAKRDRRLQRYAVDWKENASDAPGQLQALRDRGYNGSELAAQYEALAIEEGLAVVAQELRAQKQAGTRMGVRVRALANWLAGVAERMGMQRLADRVRAMTYNEAERFVLKAIDNAGEAPVGVDGSGSTGDTETTRFRTGDALGARVGDVLKGVTVTNLKQQAGFKATDYMGLGLQFLGRRQLVDVYGKLLPQLDTYNTLMAQMDADKNEAGAGADELADTWGKLPDNTKLAELMHDATLAQIDPAKDFVEGDNKTDWMRLQAQYKALSPAARDIYTKARDTYSAHMREVRKAIKERIERSEMTSERKAAMLKQMDNEFFGHTKGVYFPLARFGQYVVVVKDADGTTVNVSRAETMAEADATRKQLLTPFPASKGYTVGKVLKAKEFVADRDAVGRGFMEQLYGVLDKQDLGSQQRAELEDALGQLYLSALPDLSWAKHGIHRKGTPGFSQDARRAFAQNVFHGASYLAKLRYADQLQDQLADMDKHVSAHDTTPDYDSVRARQVVDEMQKRHEAAMNPKSNGLSTALTSAGFIFHLGLSPASAMVNVTQTALVAYPVMGAKWGYAKAGAALLSASREAAKGKNDITAALSPDEKRAFDEAVRSGVIDVTMAHDLAGISQGEDSKMAWKMRPVMKWASFMFHHAEKFNRQVTFVASYRLARQAGGDHGTAYADAVKATYDGHFDYSSNNRPRVMQGNAARVLLLFKQYGQNMVYTLVRSAQQSLKGATPKERTEARKALGGLLVMHGLAAGALGLPMVTTLLAAASMLGGSDDEPWDAQVALQNMLADTFGQKPAEVMAHGLSRLTPWDISGRVGLDKLIFPDIQEGLEGQRLGESAMAAALGPVAGIGVNVLKGIQDISHGQYQRGLEAMAPSVLRGPLKAWRYAWEGARDKTGIVIQDEVDAAAWLGQAAGFSPSTVRNATEGKGAIMAHDRALVARRSGLVEQFAMAAMAGDEEGKLDARVAIDAFNEKNPDRRIKPMQLAQSVRARTRRIEQAQEGVYLPKNRRDALEAGRFAVGD